MYEDAPMKGPNTSNDNVKQNVGSAINITHPSEGRLNNEDDDILEWPKKLNNYGKIFVGLWVILFNLCFWVMCIDEYLQPAEKYIKVSNNSTPSNTSYTKL